MGERDVEFCSLTCVCLVLKLCSKKWVLYFAQNAPFCAKFCTKCCKLILIQAFLFLSGISDTQAISDNPAINQ